MLSIRTRVKRLVPRPAWHSLKYDSACTGWSSRASNPDQINKTSTNPWSSATVTHLTWRLYPKIPILTNFPGSRVWPSILAISIRNADRAFIGLLLLVEYSQLILKLIFK